MFSEKKSCEQCDKLCRSKGGASAGGVYGLAFLGALIYYIQNAATFWVGVIGFFKAVFWPAVLMYKLLTFLKM